MIKASNYSTGEKVTCNKTFVRHAHYSIWIMRTESKNLYMENTLLCMEIVGVWVLEDLGSCGFDPTWHVETTCITIKLPIMNRGQLLQGQKGWSGRGPVTLFWWARSSHVVFRWAWTDLNHRNFLGKEKECGLQIVGWPIGGCGELFEGFR